MTLRVGALWISVLLTAGMVLPEAAFGHADARHTSLTVRIEAEGVSYRLYTWLPLLQQALGITLREPGFLRLDEYASFREQIAQKIAGVNRIAVDGVNVPPLLKEVEVSFERTEIPPPGTPEPEKYDTQKALVMLHVMHPTVGAPRAVKLDWGIWPEQYQVPGAAPAPPERPELPEGNPVMATDANMVAVSIKAFGKYHFTNMSAAQSSYTWRDEDNVPVLVDTSVAREVVAGTLNWAHGLGAAGLCVMMLIGGVISKQHRAGIVVIPIAAALLVFGYRAAIAPIQRAELPDEAGAQRIVGALLRNIYQASMYSRDEDIYDLLARSVSGDYLKSIYQQMITAAPKSGEAPESKASAQVLGVEVLGSRLWTAPQRTTPASFTAMCRWRADGVVSHYNHTHARSNVYEAEFRIAESEGMWKIVDGLALEQLRLPSPGHDNDAPPASEAEAPPL